MTADGQFHPAPGYTWVNPGVDGDFRTKRKENTQATLWETYRKAAIEAQNAGKYAEAEQLFKAAVPEAQRLGSDSPALGMTYLWLGMACKAQGKMAEAEVLYRQALPILDGKDNLRREAGDVLCKLAEVELARTNAAVALALCSRGVELHRKADDLNKEQLSGQMNLLGIINVFNRDFRAAQQAFTESIVLDPKDGAVYENRGHAKTETGDFAGAKADYLRFAELAKDRAHACNAVAWRFATSPTDELRDGQKAVELAEQAVTASGRTNAAVLDTLAAAYAEAGQFEKAVATQEEAIGLLTEQRAKDDYGSRLTLFRKGKPYREQRRGQPTTP
jgi:tetratricopeptide (TPR) repeat protein